MAWRDWAAKGNGFGRRREREAPRGGPTEIGRGGGLVEREGPPGKS